ncbi:hypothetical protein BZL30_5450 [Mycobacterium kansasii]|uniref:Uncharacterized protein n=1 Tax=Mycobacterium kansasii TaxID=1768 RepID=A0A1V3WYP3_MYCKA|nr:hypothetical protein MKSMC1_43210 [Mycobacterium kansasii]OOK68215.1 hypothetical protein BZL29_7008 [Mycobacterium kansasii]OOK72040.1 hypothetical protein BZL30_5450 [Mycobacterium kansasii]
MASCAAHDTAAFDAADPSTPTTMPRRFMVADIPFSLSHHNGSGGAVGGREA